jgi:diguanylate cyclase (GGDEF)-like protein
VRLGGDEFVVILEGVGSRQNAEGVASKIVAAMHPPFAIGKGMLRITTSGGLAFFDGESALDSDALLRKADEALYQAKAAGRNNVKIAA